MKIYDRRNQPITDWRDWTRPKEEGQWRSTRSAMELARSWFTSPVPVVPSEIADLLRSHRLTREAILQDGWPELKTPLPYPGEGRNHDLVVVGEVRGQPMLLTVEGKVDETMGPAVGTYWRKSNRVSNSRAWRRIDALLSAAFGAEAVAIEEPWRSLPYQLLTATVGTAIEASTRSCAMAVLCVHEFVTESAKPDFLARNAADFRAFLRALGQPGASPAHLYGPFTVAVPGTSRTMPVLIGKAQYRWTAR